ncbi:MAG: hypothetical protein ACLS7Z_04000 [Christensenellales bacterium]
MIEEPFTVREMMEADEVFFTSASALCCRIEEIDGQRSADAPRADRADSKSGVGRGAGGGSATTGKTVWSAGGLQRYP